MSTPKGSALLTPFNDLYERTHRHVWNVLGKMGIPPSVREDLGQNVYLKAWQVAQADPTVPIAALLRAMAVGEARNYRRLAHTRREAIMDDYELELHAPPVTETSEDVVNARRWYLRLAENLPEERREVFEMHELEGFTAPEIAGALGIPEATVYNRLRLAREDMLAGDRRMRARDANYGMALLPFGLGAWKSIDKLFDDMPDHVAERLWRRIHSALVEQGLLAAGAAGGAVAAHTVTAAAAYSKGLATGVVVGGVSGVVLGGGAVGLMLGVGSPSAPVVPEPVATHSVAVASSSAGPSPVAETAGAGTGRPGVFASATATALARRAIDPEEERLLHQAQAAVAAGNTAGAIAVLDEHARRFPYGGLKGEREALRTKLTEVPKSTPAPRVAPPAPGSATGVGPSHRVFDSDEP